ncbi:ornithine carbamoyltransferase [Malaciobacter mytili]|uniref:Ornithine carbamoyltransferase n=1 Tax=Malaciobacter mytili LMG 24559 TaxID=1032238 RepID=A0AAX2AEF9_9BACT|nr:ornithine carbamoyltransferase [Malaciobacter mytili]AXH15006.1 ornithine carbamoyltransferase [Malaciobacter mytili LMG 24559]RXI43494.1 ornithine carbamoyltransferase [Malaciobacter mytili]RXK15020.1 ornithine carbamoyltransferase [Malaciobacter mytili LMG 24559]
MRHFLTLSDYTKEEILEILDLAKQIKKETKNRVFKDYMPRKTLGMIFEKSSTRTRVSFETGIYQLGGIGLFLSANDIQLGRGEPMSDTSRVISRMVDMVMIRTFEQSKLEEFAKYSKVPVINGLTNEYHPVQLMADYMTIQEANLEEDLVVAYVGDGNNMAHSWLNMAAKLGFELRIATPKGYEVDAQILENALTMAKVSGAKITISNNPKEAITGATVVTTDTWVSMGQEDEKEKRIKDFKGYMVDSDMMKLAHNKAIFLHCLPAYRGYEVSDEVMESSQSLIFEEAENRLHAQKGVMVWLDRKRDSN